MSAPALTLIFALTGFTARRVYANTCQSPGGTSGIENEPSEAVRTCALFGSTRIVAAISGWMLQ